MSTRERKARKKAGIPFSKEPKVGTPLLTRSIPHVRKEQNGVPIIAPSNRAARRMERQFMATEEGAHQVERARAAAEEAVGPISVKVRRVKEPAGNRRGKPPVEHHSGSMTLSGEGNG